MGIGQLRAGRDLSPGCDEESSFFHKGTAAVGPGGLVGRPHPVSPYLLTQQLVQAYQRARVDVVQDLACHCSRKGVEVGDQEGLDADRAAVFDGPGEEAIAAPDGDLFDAEERPLSPLDAVFIPASASTLLLKSDARIPGRITAPEPPMSSSQDTYISSSGSPNRNEDMTGVRNAVLVTSTIIVSSRRRAAISGLTRGLHSASPIPRSTVLSGRIVSSIRKSPRMSAGVKWAFLKSTIELRTQLIHERLQWEESSMYTCLTSGETRCFSGLNTM